jgi:predicted transcriptional regulator
MEPWLVDAKFMTDLRDLNPEEDLVLTSDIKRFIARKRLGLRDHMFFAVSPKGFGKTLFLMYKRHLYETIHKKDWDKKGKGDMIMLGEDLSQDDGKEIILPSGEILERDKINISYDSGKIGILIVPVNWEKIWSLCLYQTAIKNFYEKNKETLARIITREIPPKDQGVVNELIDNSYKKLHQNLAHILGLSHRGIAKIIEKQELLKTIIKSISSGIVIFIDNVDECFRDQLKQRDISTISGQSDPMVWYAAQMGLVKAIWNIPSTHLKVFTGIRKEAYEKLRRGDYADELIQQYDRSTLDIRYDMEDLKEMFIKNIKNMSGDELVKPEYLETDPIYAFLGIPKNKITNTWVGNKKENVFEYIYRHTLNRPRDLMTIGGALTAIETGRRTEDNIKNHKDYGVDASATNIVGEYMIETKPLLNFFDFDKLFDLIHSNILTKREIREKCRVFNDLDPETCENRDCRECRETHVFCTLYKIGLLGVVWKDPVTGDEVQKFLPSWSAIPEPDISGELDDSEYYLIHPALNSLIYNRSKKSGRAEFNPNPTTIVGDGYGWKDPMILPTMRCCSFHKDRFCKSDRFLNPRGVFLASSYNKRNVIVELEEELKKLNLQVDIDKWTKREEPETGQIFCNEVCPKVFKNLRMLAEVSDFNPNVFFECGFALGFGRKVIFLCEEKADLIKSKLGGILYVSYKTVGDIINKLGWSRDTFNIKPDKLYMTPRLFNNINNFNSPNDRKKSGNVYLLSFNQEKDIIKKTIEVWI